MKVLDSVLKRENNNFDLIRLLAALMVMFFHAFYLFKSSKPYIHAFTLIQGESIGGIAVYIFFFLSGMFITSSFTNSKSNYAFMIMRIFRIWPALIVCIMITVFIVGPLVSTYTTKEYFSLRGTWDYLIHGVLLYHVRFTLPGVFNSNYYPSAVNGSIWTLPIEMICYFMVCLFGIAGVFKNKIASIVIYSLVIALYIFNFKLIRDFLSTPFPFFIAGSLLYIFRKNIFVDYRIAILLLKKISFHQFFNICWMHYAYAATYQSPKYYKSLFGQYQ
jgi:peptidoglycan/LPS O-acetylase OafA/YrhL